MTAAERFTDVRANGLLRSAYVPLLQAGVEFGVTMMSPPQVSQILTDLLMNH